MLSIIFLILIGAISIFLIKMYGRTLYLSSKLPGPPALPILGNGLLFLNKKSSENLQTIVKLCKEFGSGVRVWLGPELYIILSDPKDVEVVLSSPKYIEKSQDYKFLNPWLGDGLLVSTNKKWHKRRKILTPAFHFKILEQFVQIFDQQSVVFVDSLSKYQQNSNNIVELFPLVTLYALDVICESAMGISIKAQLNSKSEYVQAIREIANIAHERQFNFWQRLDFLYQFTSAYQKEKTILKKLHLFTDKVIHDRRDELLRQKQVKVTEDISDIEARQKKPFLDTLLEATIDGQSLSDLDIREEVDTFMFEGHDTTTSGIVFTLYCIAKHPEVQKKCIEEITRVIGNDKTTSVNYAHLVELNYLEKVIKESLRLFPSVPLIGRIVKEETTINGKCYPANTGFVIPLYVIGRDEKSFPNAEQFRPERFDIEDDIQKNSPFSYLPFSAGSRNCIGQRFAMLEVKTIVSKILRYYELALTEDSKKDPILSAELVLKSATKIHFKLLPREY